MLLDHLEAQEFAGGRVPDIGCGWGLAGVYCASVLSCDIDPEVLPIAQYHPRLNDVEIVTEARGFDSLQGAMLEDVSWIVGATSAFAAISSSHSSVSSGELAPWAPESPSRIPAGPRFKPSPPAASANSAPGPNRSSRPSPSSPGRLITLGANPSVG